MERITRDKVYAMTYWKEKCFGVSAEALVDLAVDLRAVGGIYGGNNRATEFLCLTLKLLQIQPEKEIILEFIKNEDHKYVRLLGAFYMRLVGKPTDVYQYLEPLLNDYRKVRYRAKDGKYVLTHVDEFVNNLLTKDMFCDVALPRVPHRQMLEAAGHLEPRVSALEEDIADLEEQLESAVEAAFERESKMDIDDAPVPSTRGEDIARAVGEKRQREDGELDAPRDEGRKGGKEPERRDDRRGKANDDRGRADRRSRSRSPRRQRRDSREQSHRGHDSMGSRGDGRRDSVDNSRRGDVERKEKKEKKEKKGKKESDVDPEIAEANAIRAKLGLKPLRG